MADFTNVDLADEINATISAMKQANTAGLYLLIDADIIAYRAAAASDGRQYFVVDHDGDTIKSNIKYKKDAVEYCVDSGYEHPEKHVFVEYKPKSSGFAINKASVLLHKITRSLVDLTGIDVIKIAYCLTPETTFRDSLVTDYKANRANNRVPDNLKACKDFFRESNMNDERRGDAIAKFHVEYPGEYEADDLLSILSLEQLCHNNVSEPDERLIPIIVTIDKDLDQVEGFHFNFVSKRLYTVSREEGLKSLYIQALTGDKTDNIPGLPRVGPATANKILKDVPLNEKALYAAVLKEYMKRTPKLVPDVEGDLEETDSEHAVRVVTTLTKNMRLLAMCREFGVVWSPPSYNE